MRELKEVESSWSIGQGSKDMSSSKKILVVVIGSPRCPLCPVDRAVKVRNHREDNSEIVQ